VYAAWRFAQWSEAHAIGELAAVEPSHIAAFIKQLQSKLTLLTVKQHLAALRMLFDWLVIGHIIDINPAHVERDPKYVLRKGKISVLTAEEARELLESIPLVRNTRRRRKGQAESPKPSVVLLRDRALIAVMVYSFARINAVLEMEVRDYFVQGPRGWMHLHEKGGREHEVPCHHNLEKYLDEYIAAAGIPTKVCNHTFRATGITAYLDNGGSLKNAQAMAAHESPRTTKLYDRTDDQIILDEVEKIGI
jgi:site-specific recombinase XerD